MAEEKQRDDINSRKEKHKVYKTWTKSDFLSCMGIVYFERA